MTLTGMITDYKDTVQVSTYKIFISVLTIADKLECEDAFLLGWNVGLIKFNFFVYY